MRRMINQQRTNMKTELNKGEQGSALVIALFILVLISAFVVLATTRTASEAAAVGNEVAEGRTVYAAQGSLEMMTRNFNKIFEVKLNPTQADLDTVVDDTRIRSVDGLADYTFDQELDRTDFTSKEETVVLPGGPFAGLYAIRGNWRLRTTVTDPQGVQVQLTRNILNNRIPIFQFGIFYDDDLELYRPPLFSFGGRVHSNRHFFMSPGPDGVYFDSRVTAAGHIVTQTWRNGNTGDNYNGTYIKDAAGVFRQLHRDNGSVLNGTPNVLTQDPDLPPSRRNNNWPVTSAIFDGNLQSETKQLKLPLKVGDDADQNSLIEMIKRPKNEATASGGDLRSDGTLSPVPVTAATADNDILRSERFANKPGMRISLSDSKAKLPGCATSTGAPVSTPCGVRLDGHVLGAVASGDPLLPLSLAAATSAGDVGLASRGYRPTTFPMTDGYQATRVNGERLNAGSGNNREVWIKVETVAINETNGAVITNDITADILSLGVTEEAPNFSGFSLNNYSGSRASNGTAGFPSTNLTATTAQAPSTFPDSRSVIKLQRFLIPGPAINAGQNVLSHSTSSGGYNGVVRFTNVNNDTLPNAGCVSTCTADDIDPNTNMERYGHLRRATFNGSTNRAIVPIPIGLFDMREGLYYDERNTTYYPSGNFGTLGGSDQRVSVNGIMSIVDLDVANLRRFLRGDFNGRMPTNTPFAVANGAGLMNTDIPQNGGWVLYYSDRRGDKDFDGEFDMEDVYVNGNQGTVALQNGEDANFNGNMDARFCNASASNHNCEAEKYREGTVYVDRAAVNDHKYFRRGLRLVNGTTIPGIFDSSEPANTLGFTVASENGVYVQGNYNATHVTSVPSTGNTPYNDYRPLNTPTHIPASIVGDGVTILSNAWSDARSFVEPYDLANREASETTIRFAMIAGDTIATREATPHQGGISPRLNGGVHNFKRFLERWTNPSNSSFRINLNYSGSLINLYNSRTANGSFKCCNMVYNPPVRNWVFDSTFLDPGRLPPGTPFFQYVQTTGFMRTNE